MLSIEEQKELRNLLGDKKKITLTTHNNPDGDAIGSALAMYHYLLKKGHDVSMIIPNKFPDFLSWLPGADDFVIYEHDAKKAQQLFNEAELVFCLDFNALNRFGAASEILARSSGKRILIDHHIQPEIESFDYIFSTTNTSSTGELIFDFIDLMGDKQLVDKKIAECIYTCIMTDTGSFSFAANNVKTYEITAELIGLGVDASKIHRLVYDTFSENRLRLLGHAISNKMIVWDDLHTALIYLSSEDLTKYRYQVGDIEGVVNFPLMMKKVNMAILLTEREKMIRLSFRSKGDFSVNKLARAHFKGGGHQNAAGGKSFKTLQETIDDIKSVVQQYKSSLDFEISY